ncbi:MAG: MerR family transcriptional regulator [Ktedonobacteraceae bacterium]
MAKTAQAPKNFYTATEAIKKLGMPRATFFHFVKAGKIKKVVPEGYVEGYYPKKDIDKMALAREMLTLGYTTDSSVFRRAEEEDVQGIYNLGIALFGTATTPSYEARLAGYVANPDAYYVVEQDDFIVGYLYMLPLRSEAIARIMGVEQETTMSHLQSMRSEIIVPENILQFKPGEADNIFLTVGVRQGLARSRYYGMKLISGGYDVLKDFARKGVIARKLYATSRTPDGVRLCRDIGFTEKSVSGSEVRRFELDLATSSSPFVLEYQEIARESKQNGAQLHSDAAQKKAHTSGSNGATSDSVTDSKADGLALTTVDTSEQKKGKRPSISRSE